MSTLIVRARRSPTGWWSFPPPHRRVEARCAAEVPDLLEEVEAASGRGAWAIGFVSYEAAPAFDDAFVTNPAGALPLAWFALTDRPRPAHPSEAGSRERGLELTPSVEPAARASAVARIRREIDRGETYQVNYTYRLTGAWSGDPESLFAALQSAQQGRYAACLITREWAVLSASPELFFACRDDHIHCRPMKGTAPRGRTPEEDREISARLAASEKERAENLMIVDMVRNDLGRIARPDSVRVERLFRLERYPTLWQMTSDVQAESAASLPQIFAALFPAASITGAPKTSAMRLIEQLETTPREVYTGAIGWRAPDGETSFNVAIRTAWWDRSDGTLRYGTGGGIVWDSRAESEDREATAKAGIVARVEPEYSLLETVAWRPHTGFLWLERHLDRMASSAAYFDFPFDRGRAREALSEAIPQPPPPTAQRLRLLLRRDGRLKVEQGPLSRRRRRWTIAVAEDPIDPESRFHFHKTTWRRPYVEARRGRPGFDDVLLWNPSQEATETTVANLVARLDGEWVTPPVYAGLLPGVARQKLIEKGWVQERPLPLSRLREADEVLLVNSVRGLIRASIDWRTAPAGLTATASSMIE